MRRPALRPLILASMLLGVVVLSACTKTSSTTTQTTNAKPNPGIILSASPNKGPAAGGTVVTLSGLHFTGSPAVLFGSATGTSVVVKSDTELTVTAPGGAAGTSVDITLKNADGPTSTLQQGFHYQ